MNREEILDTARHIITQDRNLDYGTPEDAFAHIAQYWSEYTKLTLTSSDVAAMMILLKIARLRSSPGKADHWIDIAGYAACGGQVATEKQELIEDMPADTEDRYIASINFTLKNVPKSDKIFVYGREIEPDPQHPGAWRFAPDIKLPEHIFSSKTFVEESREQYPKQDLPSEQDYDPQDYVRFPMNLGEDTDVQNFVTQHFQDPKIEDSIDVNGIPWKPGVGR